MNCICVLSKTKFFVFVTFVNRCILVCGALFAMCTFFACNARHNQYASKTQIVLGTVCTIRVPQKNAAFLDELFLLLQNIDAQCNLHDANSTIAKINNNAGSAPVTVSDELFFLLQKALYFAELSNGAFNPAIGALSSLWDFSTNTNATLPSPSIDKNGTSTNTNAPNDARVPSQKDIDNALLCIKYQDIILDKNTKSVFLRQKNMRLDLGAIAKGFATDLILEAVQKKGIASCIIDLGGNVAVMGHRNWQIGIADPFNSANTALSLELNTQDGAKSVVTSGTYMRFFDFNGVRYHHILDGKTGYPVQNNLASVTIIARSSLVADALSTAIFVLGALDGFSLVEQIEDVEAIAIFNDGKIITSSGIKKSNASSTLYKS